jgi:hypothetical protein
MGREVLKDYAQAESKLFNSNSGKILYHLLNSVYWTNNTSEEEVKKIEFPFWMTENLRKYQLIRNMDNLFFLISLILTILVMGIGGIIQGFGVSHRISPVLDINNCIVGQDAYFIYALMVLLLLIITPIAIISVRNLKENYGIISESIHVTTINIWFISMHIFWSSVIYQQYPGVYVIAFNNY